MRDHGTEFKTRFRLMQERVEAMKAIWTKSKPEYSGEFVELPADDDVAQAGAEAASAGHRRRRLPVRRAGARSPTATAGCRTRAGPPTASRCGMLPEFRKMAPTAGRDPAERSDHGLGVAEDADLIKRYRDAGVARIIFNLPAAKADEVLPVLDQCATLMR